jgi:vacuolar-type H+-ATPase subunit C/Vma6
VLQNFLAFDEARLLKIIYSSIYQKKNIPALPEIGIVNKALLEKIKNATIQDLGVIMRKTKYFNVFIKSYSTIEEFENALDDFVVAEFQKQRIHGVNKKEINHIAMLKIEILKEKRMLKQILRKKSVFDNNNNNLNNGIIDNEIQNDEDIQKSRFKKQHILAAEKYSKDSKIFHFENELTRYFKDIVSGYETRFFQGPIPLLSYLIRMDLERMNLFVISKGIDSKLNKDEIMGMVV